MPDQNSREPVGWKAYASRFAMSLALMLWNVVGLRLLKALTVALFKILTVYFETDEAISLATHIVLALVKAVLFAGVAILTLFVGEGAMLLRMRKFMFSTATLSISIFRAVFGFLRKFFSYLFEITTLLLRLAFTLSFGRTIVKGLVSMSWKDVKRAWKDGDYLRWTKELLLPLYANDFNYSPLPSTSSIRLLDIRPGNRSDMIICNLRTVDLDSYPKYVALSYSWRQDNLLRESVAIAWQVFSRLGESGWWELLAVQTPGRDIPILLPKILSGPGIRHIMCNGKKMRIYPSLYNALVQLRQDQPGEYWIDAVCINQENEEEKGVQIQMMGRIYGSAQTVRVWLGTCPVLFSPGIADLLSSESLPKVHSLKEQYLLVLSIFYLLWRRWFQRLWVLQEACLAKKLVFSFGEHELEPEVLLKAIKWIEDPEFFGDLTYLADRFIVPFVAAHLKSIPEILNSRESFRTGAGWNLHRWLQVTKGRQTTQNKDFVYAGLALIQPNLLSIDQTLIETSSTPNSPPPPPPRIKSAPIQDSSSTTVSEDTLTTRALWPSLRADIKTNVSDLFLNLAACVLSHSGTINLLSISYRFREELSSWNEPYMHPSRDSFPTWVPNPMSWGSRLVIPFANLGSTHFIASTKLSGDAKISTDGSTLHIDIARLDIVGKTHLGQYDDDIDMLHFALKLPENYGKTDRSSLEALAHTAIAGMWNNELSPPKEALAGFTSWLYLLVEKQIEIEDHYIERRARESDKRDPNEDEVVIRAKEEKRKLEKSYICLKERYPLHWWPDLGDTLSEENRNLASEYGRIRAIMTVWRSIFVTKEGLIGLGPAWVSEGDVVMFVKGEYVPYLFRHIDVALKAKIENRKGVLKNNKGELRGKILQQGIVKDEERIGKRDSWYLVGEAYVEGLMVSEELNEEDLKFERIGVI